MSKRFSMKSVFKYLSIFALSLVVVVIALYGLLQMSKSRTFQLFGTLVSRVETEEKLVALTFDDAPTEHSDAVLDLLAEKNVPATFYAIGKNIEKHPEAAKNIVAAGHELGNHSYTHPRFLLKSYTFVEAEIEKTNQLIADSGYNGTITFRPPYGKKLVTLPWYLSQHDMTTVTWDVEPETYMPTGLASDEEKKEFFIEYTREHTQPGSIILLHPFCDSCSPARESIVPIITALQDDGYKFVTVNELLKYR